MNTSVPVDFEFQTGFDSSSIFDKIKNEMSSVGYKYLSHGCYGTVFATPDASTVTKIFQIESNSPYIAFLEQAIQHQYNPFMPVVHSIYFIYTDKEKTEGVGIVEMERLSTGDSSRDLYLPFVHSVNWFRDVARGDQPETSKPSEAAQVFFEAGIKLATKVLKKIKEAEQKSGGCYDLHTGNFMVRSVDGKVQLVVTDPLC